MAQPIIYTVSRLNTVARLLLEQELGLVWLSAEISNLVQHSSGHWYFTLKDQKAQVKAAMFKGQNRRVAFRPQNGQQVLIQAQVSLYEARGDYQLIVEKMQPAGDGLLQLKLEALKEKLSAEGLFAQERKQPIPQNPLTVGLITSPTGAAVQDMLTVLSRRNPFVKVIVYPTQVQGEAAVPSIVAALKTAAIRHECDAYIIGRGGGSLEDLWCFNDEFVVRAIAEFPFPIISAVGHETDVTLADFASDMRAPTPSAAAEIVSRDTQQQRQQIALLNRQLLQAFQFVLHRHQMRWQSSLANLQKRNPQHQLRQKILKQDELQHRLERSMSLYFRLQKQKTGNAIRQLQQNSPRKQVNQLQVQCHYLTERLSDAMNRLVEKRSQNFQHFIEQLNALSPLNVLARGYSVTMNEQGKVIQNSSEVKEGELLTIHLHKGKLRVKTEDSTP